MGDSQAYGWDLYTGNKVATFEGHTEYLHCVKVDPRNSRLFTGSEDSTVRIWGMVFFFRGEIVHGE
jgi:WD40 repeat protein